MNPAIIFGIIIVVIWTLSGIASWINKQQEQERRRRLREQMASAGIAVPPESQGTQSPRLVVPRWQQRATPKPPPIARRVTQRAAAIARGMKSAASPTARRASSPTAPIATPPTPAVSRIEPIATPTKPPSPRNRADAPALSRWLRPETLRRQFILTEIFQPPLALRDPDRNP